MAGDKYYKEGARVDFFIKGRVDVVSVKLEKMIETIKELEKIGDLEGFIVTFDSKNDAQATFLDWDKDEEEEDPNDGSGT